MTFRRLLVFAAILVFTISASAEDDNRPNYARNKPHLNLVVIDAVEGGPAAILAARFKPLNPTKRHVVFNKRVTVDQCETEKRHYAVSQLDAKTVSAEAMSSALPIAGGVIVVLPASGAVSPEVKRILTVKKLAMPDTVVVACINKGSVSEQLTGAVRGAMAKLGFPQDLPVVSNQGFYADLMAACDSYVPMPEEHLDRPFTAHVAGVDGAGVLADVSQGFIQVGNRCDFFNKDSLDRGSISDIEVFGMATKQASAGEWVRIATDNEKADLSETTLIGRAGFARRGDKFAVDVTFVDGAVADLSAVDLQVYIDGFAYPATFSRI